MRQENEKRTDYVAPDITVMEVMPERGYAASSNAIGGKWDSMESINDWE